MHSTLSLTNLTSDVSMPKVSAQIRGEKQRGSFEDRLDALGIDVEAEPQTAETLDSSSKAEDAFELALPQDDLLAAIPALPLPLTMPVTIASEPSAPGKALPGAGEASLQGGNMLPLLGNMVNAPEAAGAEAAPKAGPAPIPPLATISAQDMAQMLATLPAKPAAPVPVGDASAASASDQTLALAANVQALGHDGKPGKPSAHTERATLIAAALEDAKAAPAALLPAAATTLTQGTPLGAHHADSPTDRPTHTAALPARTDAPLDLQSMVDRLSEARLMGRASRNAIDLPHPDYGRVTLQFTAAGNDRLAIDLPGAPAELRQAVAQGLARADASGTDQRGVPSGSRQSHSGTQERPQPRQSDDRSVSSSTSIAPRSERRRGTFA